MKRQKQPTRKTNDLRMTGPAASVENASFDVLLRKLKIIFELTEAHRPPNWMRQIESLNTLLKGDVSALAEYLIFRISGKIPGDIKPNEITFWNFLLKNGARSSIAPAQNVMMLHVVIQKNLPALRWLLEDCQFEITECDSENNPIQPGVVTHPLMYIEFQSNSVFNDYFFSQLQAHSTSHDTALILAVRYNCVPLMKWLVENKNADINAINDNGVTPLITAVCHDNADIQQLADIVDYLIQHHADTSCKTIDGLTALHFAVLTSRQALFTKLAQTLENGEKSVADIRDTEGLTILHWAIKLNLTPMMSYLESLYQIDETLLDSDGNNLAVFAASMGRHLIATHLIQTYALDIKAINHQGMNALFSCLSIRKANVISNINWLVENHQFSLHEPNSAGETPLLFSARVNNDSSVTYLISKIPGELSDIGPDGGHIGHYLAKNNEYDLIASLLKQNKLNLMHTNFDTLTMLDVALSCWPSHRETVKVCLEHIQMLQKKSKPTPLISLSRLTYLPVLLRIFCEDTLGELGPWVESGQLPLHMACLYLPTQFIQEQLGLFKLDLNQLNKQGETALYCMMKKSLTKPSLITKALWFIKTYQPKMTNLDPLGSSLLHLACDLKKLKLVKYCVETLGLSLLKTRKGGFNAMDIALITQHEDVISYLWSKLDKLQQNLYVSRLNKQGELQLITYLITHNLYEPEALETEKSELQRPSPVKLTPQDSEGSKPCEPFVCNRTLIFEAIANHRLDYIKSLKHRRAFDELLASCADEALLMAIEQRHYLLVYHVLRIPSIRERAHLNNNAALAKACELGFFTIVECLLRIPSIQLQISNDDHAAFRLAHQYPEIRRLLLSYPEVRAYADAAEHKDGQVTSEYDIFDKNPFLLNASAPEWIAYPKCCQTNSTLKALLLQLSDIVKSSECPHAYIYGSFHFKNPNDLDILLPNITSEESRQVARALINLLITDTGIITKTDPRTGEYGYRKHGLHIIPMDWRGIKIEWVLTEMDYKSHAMKLDFTIGAQYFNLRTLQLHGIPGLNSYNDACTKRLNTISDPRDSFSVDLSRVFRAIRLMADEGFHLSEACVSAITDIFSADFNPFTNMNPDKLCQQLNLLLQSPDPSKHVDIMHALGILNKLFEYKPTYSRQPVQYYLSLLNQYCGDYCSSDESLKDFRVDICISNHPNAFYSRRSCTNLDSGAHLVVSPDIALGKF